MNCRSLPSQMASSTGLSTPSGRLPAASVRRWMNSRTDSWPTAPVLTLGTAAGKTVPVILTSAGGCVGGAGGLDGVPEDVAERWREEWRDPAGARDGLERAMAELRADPLGSLLSARCKGTGRVPVAGWPVTGPTRGPACSAGSAPTGG